MNTQCFSTIQYQDSTSGVTVDTDNAVCISLTGRKDFKYFYQKEIYQMFKEIYIYPD